MNLSKLKIKNFRCYGEEEQIIYIDDLTAYIGSNSSGKTAALAALNCMYSENNSDRILKRSDFHLPKHINPEDIKNQTLYIETIFVFNELSDDSSKGIYSIPPFFQSVVVDSPQGVPYLRIRLEASWEASNTIEGAIETKCYYISCAEDDEITDDKKSTAFRRDLDQIRVLYVPAVRDPSKQLKNVSGTMMYQIMSSINWSNGTKTNVKKKIEELNAEFMNESGVSILGSSIHSQWAEYDSDNRYSDAQLRFNSTDIESSIKKSDVVFMPTVTGKEYTIDEMSDGLRSLFYISLVDSILDVETKINKELEKDPTHTSFNRRPPILTIIALEEPENHIAPHLIGKLITNLSNISKKCNAQTVLTSHSPAIVKRIEPENIRYFRLEEKRCVTQVRKITLPDAEKYSDQYKYIKESVKAYPELYFAKIVVLGEGESEEILLPKLWNAKNQTVDSSRISIVPLGGRHVNHFWRLLNDLKIPHITLLDLDREREGGGWGRIKYALNQLIKNGYNPNTILNTGNSILTVKELESMSSWDVNKKENMDLWINLLENYGVYYSAPLDIDFLMLEFYGDIYKGMIDGNKGPCFDITDSDGTHRKNVKDAEKEEMSDEYSLRINKGVQSTLKECGGDGNTYTDEQKKLMIWYSYFFLQRGKPSTHIEAVSQMTNQQLIDNIPPVFNRLFMKIESLLRGDD